MLAAFQTLLKVVRKGDWSNIQREIGPVGDQAVDAPIDQTDQVARTQVLPHTIANRIGTLMMFVVRGIFARPAQLVATMRNLAAAGQVPEWLAETDDPLGFLVHAEGASSVTDAAYRYVCHEPGVDVVLFGTGDAAHLRTNTASILKPPLPEADRAKLRELFSHLHGVGLEAPAERTR
jgi:hypothetical protein